jgi:hypothetical protein
MPMRSPQMILSRFNKHRTVRNKYLASSSNISTSSGAALLEFMLSPDTYTFVTINAVEGRWRGVDHCERHGTGALSYELIGFDGTHILRKKDLREAAGVEINGRSPFWLPSEAVLPFCNLLNFVK